MTQLYMCNKAGFAYSGRFAYVHGVVCMSEGIHRMGGVRILCRRRAIGVRREYVGE
jgi:hypothetical protein